MTRKIFSAVFILTLAMPARAASGLKVLALNIGAIPVLSAHLRERVAAIASMIKDSGYDVVALQEAWRARDVSEISRRGNLPYVERFDSGPIGTGLAILSRYPIAQSRRTYFTCRPSMLKVYHVETLSNRGILMARLKTPTGPFDVYNTQLIADTSSDRYVTLRLAQIFELSEMIGRESSNKSFVLLGDLNIGPDAPAYRVLIDLLGLQDACVKDGEDECGITNEEDGERLDHALLPDASPAAATASAAFTEPIAGTNIPYSDHEGVEAVLSARALHLRLEPNRERRLEALMRIESAIDRMVGSLQIKRREVLWIPIYGFAATLRYERQLWALEAIRARVETERIITFSERKPA